MADPTLHLPDDKALDSGKLCHGPREWNLPRERPPQKSIPLARTTPIVNMANASREVQFGQPHRWPAVGRDRRFTGGIPQRRYMWAALGVGSMSEVAR